MFIKVQKIILLVVLLFTSIEVNASESWKLLYQPKQRRVKSIALYKDKTFIGTNDGVIYSSDGEKWLDFDSHYLKKDFNGNSVVHSINIDQGLAKIYVSTSFGSYVSDLSTPSWEEVFENQKLESNDVNFITVGDKENYISSNDGFWICEKQSKQICKRENQGISINAETGLVEVFHSIKTPFGLFSASTEGVYKYSEEINQWVKSSKGIDLLQEGFLKSGFLLQENEDLYFATTTGVYVSGDEGTSWNKLSKGIKGDADGFKRVNSIHEFNNQLYLAATTGVYRLNFDKWEYIGDGLRSRTGYRNVYWLAFKEGTLFAATDEGLFKSDIKEESEVADSSKEVVTLKGGVETQFTYLQDLEPNVIEVQKAALKFAGIPTDKDFRRYQWQSRVRNLLPTIDFDVGSSLDSLTYMDRDFDIDGESTSQDFDFDRNRTIRRQEDKTRFGQINISWNTGELIYDDEVSDLVGQARLTANIRENILDEVTRIYYERRKLQLKTILAPPKTVEEKLSSYIEIAELTGQIDSRTGGWFSNDIKRRKKKLVKN